MKKMALLDHIILSATRSRASGGALLNLLYSTSSQVARLDLNQVFVAVK